MPEITRFLGIIIAMYHKEHPPPHFHAKYGDQTAVFSIQDLRIMEGSLPKRVISSKTTPYGRNVIITT